MSPFKIVKVTDPINWIDNANKMYLVSFNEYHCICEQYPNLISVIYRLWNIFINGNLRGFRITICRRDKEGYWI